MTKQEILKKAEKIIDNSKEEGYYNGTCLKAGICPKCGNGIKRSIIGWDYKCDCGFRDMMPWC